MVTDDWTGPRLPAYIRPSDRIADRFLAVWCRYCGCLHLHGEGSGHRQAHCPRETPYKTNGGYYLVDMGKPLPEGAMHLSDRGHGRLWTRISREGRAKSKGRVLPDYIPLPVPEWGREL